MKRILHYDVHELSGGGWKDNVDKFCMVEGIAGPPLAYFVSRLVNPINKLAPVLTGTAFFCAGWALGRWIDPC
jgi:hypothetical protein